MGREEVGGPGGGIGGGANNEFTTGAEERSGRLDYK